MIKGNNKEDTLNKVIFMVQKFRHIVHLIIAFFSDYLSLLGRPLFYQLQYQHFRNEIGNNIQKKKLCIF